MIPKGGGGVDEVPQTDAADVWLAGMMFDSRRGEYELPDIPILGAAGREPPRDWRTHGRYPAPSRCSTLTSPRGALCIVACVHTHARSKTLSEGEGVHA